MEPDIEVLSKVIPRRDMLVVKDPPDQALPLEVPGILGINIIQGCYRAIQSMWLTFV